ncbi:glycosyltransferase family 4 protein [Mucilaginibacter celer]|uniref:Glycosyltransferase n=1 Tax=Mucilaginibacter celer TaxID=2305508 RepID=A0A494VTB6_9SPHI|nr:glycosyltransferase family 1 protein [Mucilaginibacter celer]AYL94595.1 glycosyltransferase [Mucilaginibacter celer]
MNNIHDQRIRVGIDAKWYFDGPPSGHVVVKNLVDEIIKNNDGRFELYLFITDKFKQQASLHFPIYVKLVFLPGIPNMLSNLFLVPVMTFIYGIDVLLFQNFGSAWPALALKIAYIHDVLFLDHPEYYTPGEVTYFKQMIRFAAKADKIITISNSEKQRMLEHNVLSSNNIDVVYHGINEKFKPLSSYQPDAIEALEDKYKLPQKYLLYVGRVNIRKNLVTLVRAFALLKQHNIKLVIAGKNTGAYPQLDSFIADNGLAGDIIFTGHVPEDDLYLLYARATVFCFPSYAEGFGLPPLEAMQCGVPVVVSNRTAMPEVCGTAALYADPDSAENMAGKIELLLADADLYQMKAKQGIAQARKFSWKKAANEILTLITEAYAGRKNYPKAETQPRL